MPHETASDLLDNLPGAFKRDAGSNNYKLAEAFHDAVLAEWVAIKTTARAQLRPALATGAYLDKWGQFYGIARDAGETDALFRIRVARRFAELFGSVTYEAMLALVAQLTGTSPNSIIVRENLAADSAAHEPAVIEFQVNTDDMQAAGIPPSEIPNAIASARLAVDATAAAGVLVRLTVAGGSVWDDPGAIWDDADTFFGS